MTEEAREYDIVVVGGGGAGLMAAYAAAMNGASVIVLEKGAELGGTTALSVGTLTATGTRLQREADITDNADAHFEDMAKIAGSRAERDNLKLRRLLVDNACETVDILEKLGIVFTGPLPEPPHRVPRMHAIIPHSKGFIRQLEKAARNKHAVLRTGASVQRLITEDGRVTGVELAGGERIMVRRAVILASGDFSAADHAYKSKYMTGPLLDIAGVNPLSTGDGQRMGEAVGGEVINGDLAWGPEIRFLAPPRLSIISKLPTWRGLAKLILLAMKILPGAVMRPFLLGFVTTFLAPSHSLFDKGAILVNSSGDRFCDERDRPQDHIGSQEGKVAWIIFGAEVADQFRSYPNFISTAPGVGYADLTDYEKTRPDVVHKAANVEALAESIGVPSNALAGSVDAFHASRTAGDDRAAMMQPPFYALGPVQSWIVFSEGGLKVDENLRVLHRDGGPIPGLYAAGSAGQGGVLLEGHGHHLGWAFTSGRLAGANAVRDGV
ncbi:MAG: FAD-dependent oxidoreductase [Rhodospirillaceae bacterium]|nr:FAD-dependent oxidoreductase [Rhodospirillaceae bacterium]